MQIQGRGTSAANFSTNSRSAKRGVSTVGMLGIDPKNYIDGTAASNGSCQRRWAEPSWMWTLALDKALASFEAGLRDRGTSLPGTHRRVARTCKPRQAISSGDSS